MSFSFYYEAWDFYDVIFNENKEQQKGTHHIWGHSVQWGCNNGRHFHLHWGDVLNDQRDYLLKNRREKDFNAKLWKQSIKASYISF